MHQSGGKIKPVLRSIFPNFSIAYPFQIETKFDAWIFQM